MAIEEDRWLSEVLEREVFSVAVPARADGFVVDIRAHARGRRAMYFARVGADRIDQARLLGEAGFYVVDTGVTLARPGAGPLPEGPPGVAVADAQPNQHEAAMDIAGTAFRYSRFHLDPRIARADADRVKREWIRSYAKGRRGERLLVATEHGSVVGFLAVLAADATRVIDLIAVAPDAQGHGVGTALVAAFVRHYAACARLEVGTQAANVASIALYERCGFRVARTRLVLHMHAGAPR